MPRFKCVCLGTDADDGGDDYLIFVVVEETVSARDLIDDPCHPGIMCDAYSADAGQLIADLLNKHYSLN